MPRLSRVVARNSGRLLLTVADLATILAPVSADWNGSHVFNEQWPSHARFHGAVGLGTPVALASFALWHLWRSSDERGLARAVAAAVPISYWGSFFPCAPDSRYGRWPMAPPGRPRRPPELSPAADERAARD